MTHKQGFPARFLCLEEGGRDIKTEKGVRRSDRKREKEVGKCGGLIEK